MRQPLSPSKPSFGARVGRFAKQNAGETTKAHSAAGLIHEADATSADPLVPAIVKDETGMVLMTGSYVYFRL